MPVAAINVLHGIANGSMFLSQLSNWRLSPQIAAMTGVPSGLPHPMFAGNLGQSQDAVFDCTQLKTLLDVTGMTMADLSAANTDLHFKATTHLGTRGTSGPRFRCSAAGLACQRITAGHRTPGTANCRLFIPFDGTNEPIVHAGSQAVAGTPASAQHFVTGPVFLNGTQCYGVQEMTIEFGQVIEISGGDGEVYYTHVCVYEVHPIITFRCTDNPWAAVTPNGAALTAGSFYLRKVSNTGRVADNVAQHIKFSATAGVIFIDDTGAGGNDPGLTNVRVIPVGPDATTLPLLVNTASAITT